MLRSLKHFIACMSLRGRLMVAASLWLTTIVAIAALTVPNLIDHYLSSEQSKQLTVYLDELTSLVDQKGTGEVFVDGSLAEPRFNQPYSGFYWSVTTKDNTLRSRSLWDKRLDLSDDDVEGPKDEPLLIVTREIYLPEDDSAATLVIAIDKRPLLKTLVTLTGGFMVLLILMALGILGLIWLQIYWSFRPLKQMQNDLKSIHEGRCESLKGDYPKELSSVIGDLNALFFHYQELLSRARNHAGNLSHALKTPLAILNNEAVLLDDHAQKKMVPAIKQLQQHIDYHLGRARMAGSSNIFAARVTPSQRVDAISTAMDKVYAQNGIILVNELDSDLELAIESQDLDEIVGNIIENGYKWAQSLIRVYTEPTDDPVSFITLVIEDDGDGIADEKLESVIERGKRLDESTPGSGLGLNIAHELAHSYRGSLFLSTGKLGGLKASITLPIPRVT